MIRLLLLRFLESYFRHRWLYLLPTVVMIGLAAYTLKNLKPEYIANGVVFVKKESYLATLTSVRSTDATWWTTPAQATNGEINELLRTDAFIRAVIHKTDLEERMGQGSFFVSTTIEDTRKNIWVTVLGDNQVQINASHETPQIAYQLANAVIDAYIQWQVSGQRTESEAAEAFFAEQIKIYEAALEKARQDMRSYLEAHPEPVRGSRPSIENLDISRLQSSIDQAAARYASALDKEENARLSMAQIESDARQSYVMIDAPRLPEKPERSLKQLAIKMATFLAVGMLLTFGAIIGGVLIDRSFRFPIDIYNGIHLPVLAIVPDTTLKLKWYQRLFRRKKPSTVRIEIVAPETAALGAETSLLPAPATVPETSLKLHWYQRLFRRNKSRSVPKEAAVPETAGQEVETGLLTAQATGPDTSLEAELSSPSIGEKKTKRVRKTKEKAAPEKADQEVETSPLPVLATGPDTNLEVELNSPPTGKKKSKRVRKGKGTETSEKADQGVETKQAPTELGVDEDIEEMADLDQQEEDVEGIDAQAVGWTPSFMNTKTSEHRE
jgi:capsular polysaccharide biosynthesis protein